MVVHVVVAAVLPLVVYKLIMFGDSLWWLLSVQRFTIRNVLVAHFNFDGWEFVQSLLHLSFEVHLDLALVRLVEVPGIFHEFSRRQFRH